MRPSRSILCLVGALFAGCSSAPAAPRPPAIASLDACLGGDLETCIAHCEAGASAGCNEAGRAYELGISVPRSGVTANGYYHRACDLGDVKGCYNAGYLLETGLAGRRDPGCAVALYRMACDAGDARSCMSAGFAYKAGVDVPRDVERAAEAFRKACDVGHDAGCTQLRTLE
jgi:TPR repeat protein